MRRALLIGIGLLYVASVPWYRDIDAPLRIVFGVPDWVAVAIGCYAAAACLNAAAWLLRAPATAADDTSAIEEEGALKSGRGVAPAGDSAR